MKGQCSECGAPLGVGDEAVTCEDLFHAALALEWTDPPNTYAAHHLLVATYMLQHPSRLTPEAEKWYASVVADVIDGDLSSAQLRERHRGLFDHDKRAWNVRPQQPRPIVMGNWSATIADILDGPVEKLPERVWRWATAVRRDLADELIKRGRR